MGGDLYSGTMGKSANHGVHAETLEGREEFFFSSVVLGESLLERQGRRVVLLDNEYADGDRVKGRIYQNSALGEQDANGNWSAKRDANGDIVYSQIWLSPEEYGYDGLQDQQRFVYDASYVKLREITFGYTIPTRFIKKLKMKECKNFSSR